MIALDRIAPGKLAYQPGTGQLTMKSTTSTSGAPVVFEVKGDTISGADVPSAIAYSPNHQHIVKVFTTGYGTSEVKQKIAIDDQPPSAAEYPDIHNVAISDDGKHVAFIGAHAGENGKALTHAVYDGTEGPGYWGIKDIALSPDGLHVAYVAEKSNTKGIDTYVVIDGVEGPAFQDVLIDGAYSGQGFSANDQYHQVRFAPMVRCISFPSSTGSCTAARTRPRRSRACPRWRPMRPRSRARATCTISSDPRFSKIKPRP